MAEVLTFPEGTAQFWTGNGTPQTQVFVRDVRLMPARDTYRYGIPQKAGVAHVDLLRGNATLSLGMADSPHAQWLKGLLGTVTPGTLHVHVFALTPGVNTSGGFFAYSGTFDNGEYGGTDGEAEQRFAVNAWFETWTGY